MVVSIIKVVLKILDLLSIGFKNKSDYDRLKRDIQNALLKYQGQDVEKGINLGNSMKTQEDEIEDLKNSDREELGEDNGSNSWK